MGLDVIIGLVTIFLGIVGLGVALARLAGKLAGKLADNIDGVRDELRGDIKGLRDELRGEIAGVRVELGGRIDAVAAELTKTRIAVARLEGHVLGVPRPDTATDTATDAA
ncbi:hypothetical protein [Candidatus Palauibacter sp.]|uniref:hypothetical protein n=1 Tax=Candidatus Palauibacter sp. TaxID=3101350 RepID=UPI003B0135F9